MINEQAGLIDIKLALKHWIRGSIDPNQSDIYIFFAGHGMASPDGKDLYLLPYDGEPRLLEDSALLRSEVFATLKEANPRSVTMFIDACYSGVSRDDEMLLADADGLVDPAAARAIAAELPDAQVERFGPESAHEILREEDSVRSRAIAAIESFLNERVPTE